MSAIVARIRNLFSDARPAKRAGLILMVLAAFSVVGTSAWAYWTTFGAGTGSATTGTLTTPSVPTGVATLDTVALQWTGSDVSGGGQPYYKVERRVDTLLAWTTVCGSGETTFIAVSCLDTPVDNGDYRYRVTAYYGTNANWSAQGDESAKVPVAATVNPPSIPDLLAADDSGTSITDNITNKTSLTFSGTAPGGSTVILKDGLTSVGSQTVATGTGDQPYSIPTAVLILRRPP